MSWPAALAAHAARAPITAQGLDAVLDWAVASGFEGIDLSDSVIPLDKPHGGFPEVAKAVAARGLRVAAVNLLRAGLAEEVTAHLSEQRARWAIRAAAAFDAPVVSLSLALPRELGDCNAFRGLDHSRGSSREATARDFDATAARLARLAGEANRAGTTLAIETHHASLADTGVATLALLDRVEGVGATLDLVNVLWAYAEPEEGWRDTLSLLAPRTVLWHVKNVRRSLSGPGLASYEGVRLSQGDVDHAWCVARMREAGFDGWVSIEWGGGYDPLLQLGESLADLRGLMDRRD